MFLQVMLARSRLFGSCLAICEKLPSAVRSNGRKAFALLIVLAMGVSVPVFLVYDGSLDSAEGTYFTDKQLFGARPKQGVYPVTYFFGDDFGTFALENGVYRLNSNTLPYEDPWLEPNYYIDFTFSIINAGTLTLLDSGFGSTVSVIFFDEDENELHDFNTTEQLTYSLLIDDVQEEIITSTEYFTPTSYEVSHHLTIRVASNFVNDEQYVFYEGGGGFNPPKGFIFVGLELDAEFSSGGSTDPSNPSDPSDPTDPSDPGTGGSSDLSEVIDSITITNGHLEEISGTVSEIKDSVVRIEADMINTKEQLEDPSSPIWSAAGSAIGDAVTGLFVPDQAELDSKIDEVEQIIIDKLGDSYEIIETVEQYETELVNSFDGSSGNYAFRFPGISVPLPDGTVTILPEQDVSIENAAFVVFRDLLGIGVALLCGFSAVHILQDFVICILSGVSYWGFIRGRHDQ